MNDPNKTKKKFLPFTIIKNLWIREGEKAKARKGTKIKKPRGYKARNFGRVTFWVLFVFMFIVVVSNVFGPSGAEGQKEEVETKENPAASQEAVQYAKNFAGAYFTWQRGTNNEGLKERQEALKPYLAKGLDLNAGLSTEGLEWDSNFDRATLVQIEEKGDNKAYITLKVEAEFVKQTTTEQPAKDDEKAEKAETKTEEEKKPFHKHFVIPIAYENGTYGVYDLPKYTKVQNQTKVTQEDPEGLVEYEGGQQAIKSFLDTFFKSYAQDDQEKLSYMLDDNSHVKALEGSMNFTEVKNIEVKQDQKGNIIAYATVVLEDPNTQIKFSTDYAVSIDKKQDRFLIKELNPQ